jgi:hypothetical protein
MTKSELQRTSKGQYFIQLPGDLIKLVGWKEGDKIDVRSGVDIGSKRGDLVLRKVL